LLPFVSRQKEEPSRLERDRFIILRSKRRYMDSFTKEAVSLTGLKNLFVVLWGEFYISI